MGDIRMDGTKDCQPQSMASVILACHDEEPNLLRRCLDSLAGQTAGLEKLEVILVDRASADSTREVLQEYEGKYPDNILLIPLEEDVGDEAARNIGLSYAASGYVGFLDGDGWAEPDMYQLLCETAWQGQDDVVFCPAGRERKDTDSLSSPKSTRAVQITFQNPGEKEEFLFENRENFMGANILYRKSFLEENGIRFAQGMPAGGCHFGTLAFLYAKRVGKIQKSLYHFPDKARNLIQEAGVSGWAESWVTLYLEWEKRGFTEMYQDFLQFYLYDNLVVKPSVYMEQKGESAWNLIQKLDALAGSLGISVLNNKYRFALAAPQDKISVIIPCYNVEGYLARCLESVLCQSVEGAAVEIICVDDASTDGTLTILNEYQKKYPGQVMVIPLEANGKQGRARNIGFRHASGNYITYVDSDDAVADGMLTQLYRQMRLHPCDFVECGFQKLAQLPARDEPSAYGLAAPGNYKDMEDSAVKRNWLLWKGWETRVFGRLYRKAFLEKHQIAFPENLFMEDIYFTEMCFLHMTSCIVIDRPLYYYLVRPDSPMFSPESVHYYMDEPRVQNMVTQKAMEGHLPEAYWEEYVLLHFTKAFVDPVSRMLRDARYFSYANIQQMKKDLLGFYPEIWETLGRFKDESGILPFYLGIVEKDYSEEEMRVLFYKG